MLYPNLISGTVELTTWLTTIIPVSDYDDNTEFTDDDTEGDGVDEIDDDIKDSDIDESSSDY